MHTSHNAMVVTFQDLEFFGGFDLDGVDAYRNTSEFQIFLNPDFERFPRNDNNINIHYFQPDLHSVIDIEVSFVTCDLDLNFYHYFIPQCNM